MKSKENSKKLATVGSWILKPGQKITTATR